MRIHFRKYRGLFTIEIGKIAIELFILKGKDCFIGHKLTGLTVPSLQFDMAKLIEGIMLKKDVEDGLWIDLFQEYGFGRFMIVSIYKGEI